MHRDNNPPFAQGGDGTPSSSARDPELHANPALGRQRAGLTDLTVANAGGENVGDLQVGRERQTPVDR